jgi:hypothetical protein
MTDDTDDKFADDLHDAWAMAEWLEHMEQNPDGDSAARAGILIQCLARQLRELNYRYTGDDT